MEKSANPHVLYITAASMEEATRLARDLVARRLAACANVLGPAQSFYWWQGEVQNVQEAVVVAKTQAASVEAAVAFVKEAHSYDCPCVVAWPLEAGHPDFFDWIAKETKAG